MKISQLNWQDVKVPSHKVQTAKKLAVMLGILGLALACTSAFGAGLADTAQKADSAIKDVLKYAILIAGSVGTLVLLFKFIQAWNGHLDWMDFLKFGFFYACAGGVTAIAAYIFGLFS